MSLPVNRSSIRVVLCAYPGIYADLVIQALRKEAGIDLVGLVYSDRIFSAGETWFAGAIRLVRTSGSRYALLQFLQTDLYRWLKTLLINRPVERDIPLLHTKNVNNESGIEFLTDLNPDVILLANFNQKVSVSVINLPCLACINLHPSLLPQYKGVDPVFSALYEKEHLLGVSIHAVDENFDTGTIWLQSKMAVERGASVFYHQFHLFRHGSILAVTAIKNIKNNNLTTIANTGGHYDSWPTKAKIVMFMKRGGRLIRWSEYLSAVRQTLAGF